MKFKKGDKVKCIDKTSSTFLEIGNTYTIANSNTCDCQVEEALSGYPSHHYKLSYFKLIAEHLSEGGKDVKEFEVGDRVECVESASHIEKGQRGTVVHTSVSIDLAYIDWDTQHSLNNVSCPYARPKHGYNLRFKYIKLIATKPKTTKENNMKDNNIDSAVLATFGSKVNGDELVIIDRHFTPQMIQGILMEKHHKAIQDACAKAEAERLEKESKE